MTHSNPTFVHTFDDQFAIVGLLYKRVYIVHNLFPVDWVHFEAINYTTPIMN